MNTFHHKKAEIALRLSRLLRGVVLWGILLCAVNARTSAQESPVHAFVEGIDGQPRRMTIDDFQRELTDPLAQLVLKVQPLPNDLEGVLERIDQANSSELALSKQSSYVVGEAGQIEPGLLPLLQREFRLVVTRGKTDDLPPILISVPAGERTGVLESMAWDPKKKAFNFYRRIPPNVWHWKGDSSHSLDRRSAQQSCFRCHVNGAPVMKELDEPWQNWSTMTSRIPSEHVPPHVSNSSLYVGHSNGDQLESRVVRPWTRTWMNSLVARQIDRQNKQVIEPRRLLRHLFINTTLNLDASSQRSNSSEPNLILPFNFFCNAELLSDVFPDIEPVFVTRDRYRQVVLEKYDFRLSNGIYAIPGDTFFAFLVPVPSLEDNIAVREMVAQGIVSNKFVICATLIDFTNPVFSRSRERLWRKYCPVDASYENGESDIPDRFIANVQDAISSDPTAADSDSDERRFAELWSKSDADLRAHAEQTIKDYFKAIGSVLATDKGFENIVKLSESRRREFVASSELDEFPLLLPKNDIPLGFEMLRNGEINRRN